MRNEHASQRRTKVRRDEGTFPMRNTQRVPDCGVRNGNSTTGARFKVQGPFEWGKGHVGSKTPLPPRGRDTGWDARLHAGTLRNAEHPEGTRIRNAESFQMWNAECHTARMLGREEAAKLYSPSHSSRDTPAWRRRRLSRPTPMSPSWGFGMMTVTSPRRIYGCLPPAYGPSNPSCRSRWTSALQLTGAKRDMGNRQTGWVS